MSGILRFITADGRTIPRCGYRREDFVDDPSAEGFRTEVREPATVYRVRRSRAELYGAGQVVGLLLAARP